MTAALIRCPHCGFSKETARSKIPATAKIVRCPECNNRFQLSAAMLPVDAAEQAGSETAAPQAAQGGQPTDAEATASRPAVSTKTADAVQEPGGGPNQRRVGFDFQGTAKDYFGIWIVNTLLKIVTLGIYSPWAKVRKRSYFYGCTRLEGMNFDYLADPLVLLRGWLLAVGLFLLYTFGTNFSPVLSAVIGLLIYILMPWAIVRSRQFNNRNSAHRNIRFNFYPDYKGSYFVYFWLPLLVPLTMGLAAPYMFYKQKEFLVANNSFGKTNFRFFATGKDYYLLFLRGLGVGVLMVALFLAMTFVLAPLMKPDLAQQANSSFQVFAIAGGVISILAYFFLLLYFYVRLINLTWNNTRLGRHRFESTLSVFRMAWLYVSNGLAIMLSFGMLMPWATVRLTRYRLERLSLIASGSLDEFEAFSRPEGSAAGEEIGEIFGMDIGF